VVAAIIHCVEPSIHLENYHAEGPTGNKNRTLPIARQHRLVSAFAVRWCAGGTPAVQEALQRP
jgi:hypothetical protein